MLDEKSYKAVKAQAEAEGLEFWALIAKAVTYYIRKKTGSKVKLTFIPKETRVAERHKKWEKIEEAVMEELVNVRPKGLTSTKLQELLEKWDLTVSRTALHPRLDSLVAQEVVKKRSIGHMFGKTVYHWFITEDDDKMNAWFDAQLRK